MQTNNSIRHLSVVLLELRERILGAVGLHGDLGHLRALQLALPHQTLQVVLLLAEQLLRVLLLLVTVLLGCGGIYFLTFVSKDLFSYLLTKFIIVGMECNFVAK